jgi:lipoprotein NlpD
MTTPSLTRRGYRKALPALMAGLALAGCASQEPAPIVYRGGANPAASAPAAPAPAPLPGPQPVATDASGVVDYGGYSAMIARNGDTVESMAARVGLSASELASYNGLPSGYQPRAGDELILPPRPEGYAVSNPVAPAPVETASLDPEAPAAPAAAGAATGAFEPAPSAPTESGGFDLDRIEASLDEPAARTESPTPDAAPAPARSQAAQPQSTQTQSVQPQPPAPAPAETALAAPAPSARFIAPVDAPIARGFGEGGDGVDYAASAGTPVSAAGDGQVALVSDSLGGYGTIVLIRHRDSLLTLYGRIDEVSVSKGDRVRQGQQIGVVAAGGDAGDSLHFEVREGVESVDPARYVSG